MNRTDILLCLGCRHLSDDRNWICKAFRQGIPDDILTEEHNHRTPYPGDNGIMFEPVDGLDSDRVMKNED